MSDSQQTNKNMIFFNPKKNKKPSINDKFYICLVFKKNK